MISMSVLKGVSSTWRGRRGSGRRRIGEGPSRDSGNPNVASRGWLRCGLLVRSLRRCHYGVVELRSDLLACGQLLRRQRILLFKVRRNSRKYFCDDASYPSQPRLV
jgi:hypothetical protein